MGRGENEEGCERVRVSPGGPGSRTGAGTGDGARNGTGGGDSLGHTRRARKRSDSRVEPGGSGKGRNRGNRSGLPDCVLFESKAVIDPERSACVVCCVDDTDDLSGEMSTGYVAERIADTIAGLGGAVRHGITRHQLLLAEEVAYTSHNSAMCFMAYLPDSDDVLIRFRENAAAIVEELSVPESDPGLCVAVIRPHDAAAQGAALARAVEALAAFGHAAQTRVCSKEEAYELADSIPWVSLSEHGGEGIGVIGAIAGVGLRLEGRDGRFRGKWDLAHLMRNERGKVCVHENRARAEAVMVVEGLCESLARMTHGSVRVINRRGEALPEGTRIVLSLEAKPILYEGSLTFVVEARDGAMHPAEKIDLGSIGNGSRWDTACERFVLDSDPEERLGSMDRRCANCLYRRWTPRGFDCVIV